MGTFDLLHYGHIRMLNRCKALGELTVGVNTDEFAASYKRLPVMTEYDRSTVLAELGFNVMLNDSPGRDLIERVKPDILAASTDWANRDYYKQINMSQSELDDLGVSLVYIPHTPGISTTEIIGRFI